MLNASRVVRAAAANGSHAAGTTPSHYDIAVVGGGLVGNAIAACLGRSKPLAGKRITVLDNAKDKATLSSQPSTKPYSNRVSAVSPASIALFRELGIWQRLEVHRVKRVDKLHVIESSSRAEITFDRPDNEEIAYIVENDAIVGALGDLLGTLPTVSHRTGAAVVSCDLPDDCSRLATVSLEGGENITADLVIGADGANSAVRSSSSVDTTAWTYAQSGVVATLKVADASENATAWQRFSVNGPIALLPLTRDLSSLVWTTTPEEAKRLCSIPADVFVDELNEAFVTDVHQDAGANQALFALSSLLSAFSAGIKPTSSPPHVVGLETENRAAFPLGFAHASAYVAPRMALVGDAAHRVHPLAGQGVNLGWRDCRTLTRTLEKAVESGADIGSVTALRHYDTEAQAFNVPTMVAIDWLNRLYRTQAAPIVLARSLGLSAVNSLTPLKDLFVHTLSHYPK